MPLSQHGRQKIARIHGKHKDDSPGPKFKKVMGEYGDQTLKSSSGDMVTSYDQALAIAFSEQREADKSAKG